MYLYYLQDLCKNRFLNFPKSLYNFWPFYCNLPNTNYNIFYCFKKTFVQIIGKWDVHVIAPDGKKLRSNPEIEKYLQLYPEVAHDEQVTKTSPWPEDIYNIYMKSYQVPEKKIEANNKILIQDLNSNPNSKEHFA